MVPVVSPNKPSCREGCALATYRLLASLNRYWFSITFCLAVLDEIWPLQSDLNPERIP